MKSASPYIFTENCKEVMEYYQHLLGGEVKNIQMSDGIEGFEGQEGKVLHAELHLGESVDPSL
ncbi:VOC family protein [Salinibacillus xinjiangensis]|uniref:VOC family protein n=1 Tax=Salinibacillus xinjiangensis TaxID=1229268 RepID=UPI001E488E50|nr:hypothetical protein [Salinibacillus xinjiangensis]